MAARSTSTAINTHDTSGIRKRSYNLNDGTHSGNSPNFPPQARTRDRAAELSDISPDIGSTTKATGDTDITINAGQPTILLVRPNSFRGRSIATPNAPDMDYFPQSALSVNCAPAARLPLGQRFAPKYELPQQPQSLDIPNIEVLEPSPSLPPSRPQFPLLKDAPLPRLPTPDFSSLKTYPYKQALTAPLKFLRRGFSTDNTTRDSVDPLAVEGTRVDPSAIIEASIPLQAVKSEVTTQHAGHLPPFESTSSSIRSQSSIKLIPNFKRRSHYIPPSHRYSRQYEEDDQERDGLLNNSVPQDPEQPPYMHSGEAGASLDLPPSRHPGLSSPAFNVTSLIPILQQTSARFTQKFPSKSAHPRNIHFVPLSGGDSASSSQPQLDSGETLGGLGMESIGRWTKFKWALMLSVVTVFISGILALLLSLYTWFGLWNHARLATVVDYDLMIFLTLAATSLLITSLFGFSGTLLNSRPILGFYCFLLWPSFISILIVGYTSYKRRTFNLEGKLAEGWSRVWNDAERSVIQNTLRCCGYYSPLHDIAITKACYPRAPLPGCKGRLLQWEKIFLKQVYTITFSTVPLHIGNIITSLLCSNHVNRTFGKGLTPKAYRLSLADVQENAKAIISQYRQTRIPHVPNRPSDKKVKDLLIADSQDGVDSWYEGPSSSPGGYYREYEEDVLESLRPGEHYEGDEPHYYPPQGCRLVPRQRWDPSIGLGLPPFRRRHN